jgi:hypothetical protein
MVRMRQVRLRSEQLEIGRKIYIRFVLQVIRLISRSRKLADCVVENWQRKRVCSSQKT